MRQIPGRSLDAPDEARQTTANHQHGGNAVNHIQPRQALDHGSVHPFNAAQRGLARQKDHKGQNGHQMQGGQGGFEGHGVSL
ncbi:hypothetical protein D3C71_1884460 [compost metagenome]